MYGTGFSHNDMRRLTLIALGSRLISSSMIGNISSSGSSSSRVFQVITTTDDERVAKALRSICEDDVLAKTESIESVYEWNGKVERDNEIRLIWDGVTEGALDGLVSEIERVHEYDTPMIVTIPPPTDSDDVTYLKGRFEGGSFEMAASLVKKKLVGCAQMTSDKVIDLKTTRRAQKQIDTLIEQTIQWEPISANTAYLKWLEDVVSIIPPTSTTTTSNTHNADEEL